MACPGGQFARQFARIITTGGLLLLPVYAQNVPARLRGPRQPAPAAQPAATAQSAPAVRPTPAVQPAATAQPTPAAQPQAASPVAQSAPSLLQQPAQEAQVILDSDRLSILADNSSLSAILHQVASKSGMKIDGLGTDERVFGSFGPGAPRDVLADLLNGTAYNVVLLGDLSDGAPRELILTPATHGGVTPASAPVASTEEAASEPEPEPQPPPEVPAQGPTPPISPGVKTPQQLFEQLQRMRQAQQQGGAPQQGTTQQDPQQQQAPQ